MLQSVYKDGVAMYQRQDIFGKAGRVAMEISMSESLIALGHIRFNGITLNEHITALEVKYTALKKVIDAMKGGKR